jgi:ribosomal protein S18 acetylase RimI-like enzyme
MPPEPVKIEPAIPADIPALSALLSLLFEQEAEFTPDPAAQARGLARIINDPATGLVLVARRNDDVVGMVNLLFTVSTALGEPVALLEDLIVAPAARGSGIGSQLLTAAITASRQRGCRRITLLTDRGNAAAQRFYAKHGFTGSTMQTMRLHLT